MLNQNIEHKILALDISTKTGWAIFEKQQLTAFGTVYMESLPENFGQYPYNYIEAVSRYVDILMNMVTTFKPDAIIIEETTPGRENFSQKLLLFIHCMLLNRLQKHTIDTKYIQTGIWRKTVGLRLSKQEAKGNQKKNLLKAQQQARTIRKNIKKLGSKRCNVSQVTELKQQLKQLQSSRVTRKHLSVNKTNELFHAQLKIKDNDQADAILLGWAFLHGAQICDGKRPHKHSKE